MKKPLLVLLATVLHASTFAQVQGYAEGEVVNDFTVTDTDGNVHNLYSITASGKHVMLDFFFDTCPPCQQTQPFFNQLHETYGCNGNDLFVISINNGTDNNAAVVAFEATYGGSYAHSPAVGIEGGCAAVDAAFDVVAYPTYCLIGPDNQLKRSDIWPINNMQSYVNAFPTGSNIQPAPCALTSVAEQQDASTIGIHPNPSQGPVQLTNKANGRLVVEIFDALGRPVVERSILANSVTSLDLGHLPNGAYFVRSTGDDQRTSVHRLTLAH